MFIKLTDFLNPEKKVIIDIDKICYMCICTNVDKVKGTHIKMIDGSTIDVVENEQAIISLMKDVKLTFMSQMEE